jgi:sugar fermentation stimulation protein A
VLSPNVVDFYDWILGMVMEIKNDAFIFETALRKGLIHRRRNRFILDVEVNGIIAIATVPPQGV